MKAFLMYKDRDFDLQQQLPIHEQTLTKDLALNTLFDAMALGDRYLRDVARKAILTGLQNDLGTILYRQNILRDCVNNATILREMYDITVESLERRKKAYFGVFARHPSSILYGSREVLQIFIEMLKKLKNIAEFHANKFRSEGFTAFFTMLKKELTEEYFALIQNHLRELKFRNGVFMSAELGKGNEGTNYTLHRADGKKQHWMKRIFIQKFSGYTFYISDRDESGFRALAELKDRGINLVANALAQSTDHILNFFNMLRAELAFYVGCLNLYKQLAQMESPICYPVPVASCKRAHSFKGLYDVCLALTMKRKVVGNEANADNKDLVIITGANQGGKSTFLRSIGLAQLMMQCGMFAPAEFFSANICDNLFTHYKREEDPTMKSGKLDEELSRMSDIVDNITTNSLLLLNESFAATNEREGSEISRQIIHALFEKRIKVFFVTHLYEFPMNFMVKERKPRSFFGLNGKTTEDELLK